MSKALLRLSRAVVSSCALGTPWVMGRRLSGACMLRGAGRGAADSDPGGALRGFTLWCRLGGP